MTDLERWERFRHAVEIRLRVNIGDWMMLEQRYMADLGSARKEGPTPSGRAHDDHHSAIPGGPMTDQRAEFRDYLLRFLHIPYRWGGDNPLSGLDCSGLVQLALDYLLLDPPGDQSADGLFRHFVPRADKVVAADLGDLVFYGDPAHVTHVAVALDRSRMIEAGGGDSQTLTREQAAAKGAYVKVSRIARRRDLVAILRPHALPWLVVTAVAGMGGGDLPPVA